MDKLNFQDIMSAVMTRRRPSEDELKVVGKWKFEIFNRETGKVRDTIEFLNLVTNVGKNALLDTMFNQATQVASNSWYMGLITNTGFSAIAPTDTAASHPGWNEFVAYTQATRPLWGQGVAASQSITNSTPVTFSINATGTIKGGFIISQNTKGGTTGLLWSAGLYAADVPVNNLDDIKATYTVST